MEGFAAYNYPSQYLPYAEDESPATESGSASPQRADIMLAENNPKKRAGRRKFKETRHPVYRGIRQRGLNKWVSELREPNKKTRIWLGTFLTAEMAARAHDVAVIALRGRSACLNFADSAWRLPVPASGDTKDIQRAAAEAAGAFGPRSQAAVEATAAERNMNLDVVFTEEDLFEMPEILAHMYNGMMLPPPDYAYVADDYLECDVDLPLWSY